MQNLNDVLADGKSDCALAIELPIGGSVCCSCTHGSFEPRIIASWIGGRAVIQSVSRDSAYDFGVAGPALSCRAAGLVDMSAVGVVVHAAGRLNLVRGADEGLTCTACLHQMRCLAQGVR